MSHDSNKARFILAGAAAFVMLGLLLPVPVSAATNREGAFCASLPATIQTLNTSMSKLEDKLSAARDKRTDRFATNHQKWDEELESKRLGWDAKRQENFSKMEAKARTDEQKAAVQSYKTTLTNAIATRRTANDAAREAYQNSIQDLVATQRSTVDQQVNTFKAAVANAITAAEASCAADASRGATVRTTFREALKNARQAYTGERRSDEKLGEQIRTLAQARNASIKANNDTFKAAAEAARNDLKKAFDDKAI